MHGKLSQTGNRTRKGGLRRLLVGYPRAVPVVIFLAIAAVTLLSVFAIESNARQSDRAHMREYARTVASSLDRRGNSSSSYLRAAAALFSSSDDVSSEKFRQFVNELRLDTDHRSSEGIGWAEVGAADDLANRQATVTYLLPETERNRRALGFNLYSEPVRSAAMDEAKRTVRPTASGKVVLVQEGASDAPGFLIFMPVYKPRETGRVLEGYVYSPFNAAAFLDVAVPTGSDAGFGVALYDGDASDANLLAQRAAADASGEVMRQQVRIANRPLLLVVEASRSSALASLSMVTLLFGLAVASLLMLLARLLTRQAVEDQARLEYFEEQNSIRTSLTRELNHRVKNTLANVLSILSLTRRRTDDLDEFADGLEGRIRALSATHDLLTSSEWGMVPIGSVVEAEIAHFRKAQGHEIVLDGPAVQIAPNDALTFGLAIHELATNAAKYGALSKDGGKVEISWSRVEGYLARVEWRETGGPAVKDAGKRGFGTELIEKIVAHELKHPVELDFNTGGVVCVLHVPVRGRSDFQIREKRR